MKGKSNGNTETTQGPYTPQNPRPKIVEKAPEQRRIRQANRGQSEYADWSLCDPLKLQRAIASVAVHGFAIRLGYTRDSGAYAIGIIGDGEPFTEYVRPTEDIDLYLDGLIADYAKTG